VIGKEWSTILTQQRILNHCDTINTGKWEYIYMGIVLYLALLIAYFTSALKKCRRSSTEQHLLRHQKCCIDTVSATETSALPKCCSYSTQFFLVYPDIFDHAHFKRSYSHNARCQSDYLKSIWRPSNRKLIVSPELHQQTQSVI
jgi:hypothetical protein